MGENEKHSYDIVGLIKYVNEKKEYLYSCLGKKKVEAFLNSTNCELIELHQMPSTTKDLIDVAYWEYVLNFYSGQLQVLQDLQRKEIHRAADGISKTQC